jgi:hypothetical protein
MSYENRQHSLEDNVFYSAFTSICNVKDYYNFDTLNVSIKSYNANVREFFILLIYIAAK